MVKVDASLQKLFRVPEKFAVPLSGNHEQLNAGWCVAGSCALEAFTSPWTVIVKNQEL